MADSLTDLFGGGDSGDAAPAEDPRRDAAEDFLDAVKSGDVDALLSAVDRLTMTESLDDDEDMEMAIDEL